MHRRLDHQDRAGTGKQAAELLETGWRRSYSAEQLRPNCGWPMTRSGETVLHMQIVLLSSVLLQPFFAFLIAAILCAQGESHSQLDRNDLGLLRCMSKGLRNLSLAHQVFDRVQPAPALDVLQHKYLWHQSCQHLQHIVLLVVRGLRVTTPKEPRAQSCSCSCRAS